MEGMENLLAVWEGDREMERQNHGERNSKSELEQKLSGEPDFSKPEGRERWGTEVCFLWRISDLNSWIT